MIDSLAEESMNKQITYNEVKMLYKNGMSLSNISSIYKMCRHRLARLLKQDGIVINQNNQKFLYNSKYFSKIDTEEKAYWFGFLYADGYICNNGKRHIIELCLAECDLIHLEKFKRIICPEKPIYKKESTLDNKTFISYRYSILNKEMVLDLINNGCLPNKSLIIEYPQIPKELNRHFIRGYFDGDGSITISRQNILSICSGSISFLENIQNIFIDEIDKYTKVKILKDKRSNTYSLQKGGKYTTHKVMSYLYDNASIFLDRKYQKYLQLLQLLPSK